MYEAFVHQTKPLVAFLLVATSLFSGGGIALADDVESRAQYVVEIIKNESGPDTVRKTNSRAMGLPEEFRTSMLGKLKKFHYESPEECGGHHFNAYEAKNQTLILEYRYLLDNGDEVFLRDYVYGPKRSPNSLEKGGLWGEKDHKWPLADKRDENRPTKEERMTGRSTFENVTPRRGSMTSRGVRYNPQSEQDQNLLPAYAAGYHKALLDVSRCTSMVATR